ncbi:MAG TPA: CO dehydrogenase/CO-methylating acetyl-CoA synthase complex subunit beta [Methanoregulaceae archaeon]|nr:CO dehydrogenase/CO-methylating acetyl-CoA synthase complex subunit beta [Methanoregulaceae archaeon]
MNAKEGMFSDIPVNIGVVYEGERIRKQTMHVELGGPQVKEKFEILRVKDPEEINDGEVRILGPDLPDMAVGSSIPFGICVMAAGAKLEPDMESVMERRIHDFCNWIEGFMHLNQRDTIWIRADKRAVAKGLTLAHIGTVMVRLFRSALPIIEKVSVTFITDPALVHERYKKVLAIYEERDARTRGMTDDDVDVFYGCSLCQSFAPSHVCVITPERYANCGAISWLDGRAAARVDPKGPIYEIPKGECIDHEAGEYAGVNEVVKEKSLSDVTRVQLYTAFGYPHTSCGCFECTTFYVPECDGLGIVNRDFRGTTPTGLTFGSIADSTGGGRQVDGFHGLSFEYMRSPKFLRASGGWERIIWMPSGVREKLREYIPFGLYDKIATEHDAGTVEELKSFIHSHHHPILSRTALIEKEEEKSGGISTGDTDSSLRAAINSTGRNTGVTITFRDVRISADRIFVRKGGNPGGR